MAFTPYRQRLALTACEATARFSPRGILNSPRQGCWDRTSRSRLYSDGEGDICPSDRYIGLNSPLAACCQHTLLKAAVAEVALARMPA